MKNIQIKQFQSFAICISLIVFVALACKVSDDKSNQLNKNSSPLSVSSPTPKVKSQSMENDVVLTFNIEVNGSRKPQIVGETNLPDGTELMFSIEGKSVKYNGQSEAVVQSGRFQSESFSYKQNDLAVGQYEAEVSMPISEVQPQTVRNIIGQKGENLKGSLVKKSDLGVTVASQKPFQLKSDGTISLTENKSEVTTAEKNAFEVFDNLKQLEQQGRNMESLRSNQSTEKIKECGNLMRERQPLADDLRSKAESLPQPFSILLTSAAIELKLCVSCASSAIDNCNRAKTSLDQAGKDMQKRK
jgi:hypothetical protein